MDFRQVKDNEWHQYAQLNAYLDGNGVPNIDEAIKEIFLQPIHIPFRELVNAGMLNWMITNRITPELASAAQPEAALDEAEIKTEQLCAEIQKLTQSQLTEIPVAKEIRRKLSALLYLPVIATSHPKPRLTQYKAALEYLNGKTGAPSDHRLTSGNPGVWGTLLGWNFTHLLGKTAAEKDYCELSRSWLDEWLLGKILAGALRDLGLAENEAWRNVGLIKVLITHHDWWTRQSSPDRLPEKNQVRELGIVQGWLKDPEVHRYLGVNRYQEILWFNKESFEALLWWLYTVAVVDILVTVPDPQIPQAIRDCYTVIQKLQAAEAASDYQIEKMLKALS